MQCVKSELGTRGMELTVPQLMQATILQPSCPWSTTKAFGPFAVWRPNIANTYQMRIENFDSPLKLRQGALRLSISNDHWESIQLLAWCQLQSDLIVLWEKEQLRVTEHPAYR